MKLKLPRQWPLIAGAVVAAAAVIGGYASYRLNLRPANLQSPAPEAFSIAVGQGTPVIAKQLEDRGIIRSRWAFSIYVTLHGLRRQIQAGYYELSPADSAITNAKIIARGIVVNKAFLVREGATLRQIQDQAIKDWLRGNQLPEALKESYPNNFLAQRPAGSTLEGYLFPDTYSISPAPCEPARRNINNLPLRMMIAATPTPTPES